ncbi:MAG TPA: sugar phosphate isomerase/epimerase [Gemmatimonadaceae bacterium]|nr:sugar phosphate isomerase/epimerase [Gemmatimonadaceae bacterium]
MTELGIMQGRLVPRIDGRIQAFPRADWMSEFPIAADLGFDLIEFIFEGPRIEEHPFWSVAGIAQVREVTRATGVEVRSVCADYFMEQPLFRGTAAERRDSLDVLLRLLAAAGEVGARCVEIPCVDQSSLKSPEDEQALLDALGAALEVAKPAGVSILLETDLPPERFRRLLAAAGDPMIGANFDSGNSASLGYDPDEEIKAIGEFIQNVHIKDRILGGTTVPLGTGAVNFDRVFRALAEAGYGGALVIQGARGADDAGVARDYLSLTRALSEKYLDRV